MINTTFIYPLHAFGTCSCGVSIVRPNLLHAEGDLFYSTTLETALPHPDELFNF